MAFRWPNLSRDRSGNVVTLFALISPVLITIMALAIDVAVVGHKKRELQNASDLAAILARHWQILRQTASPSSPWKPAIHRTKTHRMRS